LCNIQEFEQSAAFDQGFRPTSLQPWIARPYDLVSWWDMEKFSAHAFFLMGELLEQIRLSYAPKTPADTAGGPPTSQWSDKPDEIVQPNEIAGLKELLVAITSKCDDINLRMSRKFTEAFYLELDQPIAVRRIAEQLGHLIDLIRMEMEDVLFLYVPTQQTEFYNKTDLLGKDVSTKFPALQFDIVEAGNCYALGRGTAAVFHLMRIMEVGVQEFGKKLSVSLVNEKNWQNILDEINKAIKALPKGPQVVEMSQASANLYAVKLAWRNEVMHPKDTYTLEEAETLIRQGKIFMEQLAKII
jgi:hypothetical protein